MINGCYVCFSPVNYSWLASVTRCGLAWLWNAADLMSSVCVSVIHHHTQTTQQCVCLCVHMCVVWEHSSCCFLRSYLPNTHTATEIHTHSWRVVLISVQQVLPLMTKAAWKAAKDGLTVTWTVHRQTVIQAALHLRSEPSCLLEQVCVSFKTELRMPWNFLKLKWDSKQEVQL